MVSNAIAGIIGGFSDAYREDKIAERKKEAADDTLMRQLKLAADEKARSRLEDAKIKRSELAYEYKLKAELAESKRKALMDSMSAQLGVGSIAELFPTDNEDGIDEIAKAEMDASKGQFQAYLQVGKIPEAYQVLKDYADRNRKRRDQALQEKSDMINDEKLGREELGRVTNPKFIGESQPTDIFSKFLQVNRPTIGKEIEGDYYGGGSESNLSLGEHFFGTIAKQKVLDDSGIINVNGVVVGEKGAKFIRARNNLLYNPFKTDIDIERAREALIDINEVDTWMESDDVTGKPWDPFGDRTLFPKDKMKSFRDNLKRVGNDNLVEALGVISGSSKGTTKSSDKLNTSITPETNSVTFQGRTYIEGNTYIVRGRSRKFTKEDIEQLRARNAAAK